MQLPASATPQVERKISVHDVRGLGGLDIDGFERQVSAMSAKSSRSAKSAQSADELKWTRKFVGGLRRDIRNNLPYYKSDWTDAFGGGNFQKTTSSIIFLFFACLTPALAFGGVYYNRMGGEMGVSEAIISTAMSGVIYAVCAGQPLNIIGATGPKFAFMITFYNLCVDTLGVDFLVARLWMGLWGSLFMCLFAVFEASCLMQWATRFMEEIFVLFVGLTFVEASLRGIFDHFGRSTGAGLLAVVLGFGTCYMVIQLKALGGKPVGNRAIRAGASNFAVAISLLAMSLLAHLSTLLDNVDMPKLEVPSDLSPSRTRSWLINPFGGEGLNKDGVVRDFKVEHILLMALPGAAFALLNYMDQNTTSLLINRPANGVTKPVGYHLDLLVLGLLYIPCALFGVVFPAGSTVPALTHVISLTTYEDRPLPGGGVQKVAVKVVEQRWTGTMIHVLIFLALFAGPVLKKVPMAVVLGVFLYMGLASRQGIQMWDRFMLWLNFEPKTYPRLPYFTRVGVRRMHLYTSIQVVMLGILYGLNEAPGTGVLLPFVVAGLVPFRVFVLPKIFTEEELEALDAHDDLPPDAEPFASDLEKAKATQGKGAEPAAQANDLASDLDKASTEKGGKPTAGTKDEASAAQAEASAEEGGEPTAGAKDEASAGQAEEAVGA